MSHSKIVLGFLTLLISLLCRFVFAGDLVAKFAGLVRTAISFPLHRSSSSGITRDRRTNRPLSDVHPPPTIGLAVRTSSPASYPSKRAHGIVPPHRHHQGCVSSPPSRLSSTKAFAKVRCGARAQKHRAPAHSRVLAWQVIVEKLQLEIQRKHVPQEKEQGILMQH